jgi:hypothetical protein
VIDKILGDIELSETLAMSGGTRTNEKGAFPDPVTGYIG